MSTNKEKTQGMPISSVVADWLEFMEWTGEGDEIEINEDKTASTYFASIGIADQGHRFYIESQDSGNYLVFYLYTPFEVPPSRVADLTTILNRLNDSNHFGFLSIDDTTTDDQPEKNPIRFKHCIDVNGSTLSVEMINITYRVLLDRAEKYYNLLSAIALTKQPVEQLWQEYLESQDQDEVPDEL